MSSNDIEAGNRSIISEKKQSIITLVSPFFAIFVAERKISPCSSKLHMGQAELVLGQAGEDFS
jgi:hypothetical protein